MTYLFNTTTTMKPYNSRKWWIDRDIIPPMRIEANSIEEALNEFAARCEKDHYIGISNNALKTKSNMYVDRDEGSRQVGYVLTGKTDFQGDDYNWTRQYIELWTNIDRIENAFA